MDWNSACDSEGAVDDAGERKVMRHARVKARCS